MTGDSMEKETRTTSPNPTENADANSRREFVRKLGKYATYAAPFTILAFSAKADSGSSGGPSPQKAHKR